MTWPTEPPSWNIYNVTFYRQSVHFQSTKFYYYKKLIGISRSHGRVAARSTPREKEYRTQVKLLRNSEMKWNYSNLNKSSCRPLTHAKTLPLIKNGPVFEFVQEMNLYFFITHQTSVNQTQKNSWKKKIIVIGSSNNSVVKVERYLTTANCK